MFNRFIILTELGEGIGFGHYARCAALYQCLTEMGISGHMYVNQVNNNFSFPFSTNINWLKNINILNNLDKSSVIIIDSYLLDLDILRKITKLYKNIVIIDDYNRMTYEGVSLVINPNVYFSLINYSNQTAKTIGGKDFIILRKPFKNLKPKSTNNKNCLNILVTIGGSDYRNLLPIITNHLIKNTKHNIKVIDPEDILIKNSNSQLTLLSAQNEFQILELMDNADIVVSACGQTLNELASMGKPTIGICIDKDQILNQEFYFKNKFLPDLIYWNDVNLVEKISNAVNKYEIIDCRKKIEIGAPNLINKFGVNNISEILKVQYEF